MFSKEVILKAAQESAKAGHEYFKCLQPLSGSEINYLFDNGCEVKPNLKVIKKEYPIEPVYYLISISDDFTPKKYNKKRFLAPKSINSMSAIHIKKYDDGKAVIRISDCLNSIRFWNMINTPEGKEEMLTKISSLESSLNEFKEFLNDN